MKPLVHLLPPPSVSYTRTAQLGATDLRSLRCRLSRDCLRLLTLVPSAFSALCRYGTVSVLKVMRSYLLIGFSKRATLIERVAYAGYVSNWMSLNFWLNRNDPRVNSSNFYPAQTTRHTIMSCHALVLLMMVQRKTAPGVPFNPWLSGTDALERFFSDVGGFGKNFSQIRNYNYATLLEQGCNINTLRVLFALGKLKVCLLPNLIRATRLSRAVVVHPVSPLMALHTHRYLAHHRHDLRLCAKLA